MAESGGKRNRSKREMNGVRIAHRSASWHRCQKKKDRNVIRSSHGKWTRAALIEHQRLIELKHPRKDTPHAPASK